MGKLEGETHIQNLKMANEDFYRKQAMSYRNSEAYCRMTRLYPLLQTTINECQGEKLIN